MTSGPRVPSNSCNWADSKRDCRLKVEPQPPSDTAAEEGSLPLWRSARICFREVSLTYRKKHTLNGHLHVTMFTQTWHFKAKTSKFYLLSQMHYTGLSRTFDSLAGLIFTPVTNMLLINGWNTLQNAFNIGLNWETNNSVSPKLGIDLHVKIRS